MPLVASKQHAGDYHGKDGLGDVPDPSAPGLELLQKNKAAQAMIKIVNENQGEVRQTGGFIFININYIHKICSAHDHFQTRGIKKRYKLCVALLLLTSGDSSGRGPPH